MKFCNLMLLSLILCFLFTGCGEEVKKTGPQRKRFILPASIMINGGAGNASAYGKNGSCVIQNQGTFGIEMMRGELDTLSMYPTKPVPELGNNPLILKWNTVVNVYENGAEAAADKELKDTKPYMILGDTNLYMRDSSKGDSVVTGLRLMPGYTLTFGLNWDSGGESGQDSCNLSFTNDLDLRGAVTVKSLDTGNMKGTQVEKRHGSFATSRDRGSLRITSEGLILLDVPCKIEMAGESAGKGTNERGGDGGSVILHSSNSDIQVWGKIYATGGNGDGTGNGGHGARDGSGTGYIKLISDSGFVSALRFTYAQGGDGANGGDGGGIELSGKTAVYAKGMKSFKSNGGEGLSGNGGNAADVKINAVSGGVFSSSRIEAIGGNGTLNGGSGGSIRIMGTDNGSTRDVIHHGLLHADGGEGGTGKGGDGGVVYIEAWGGDIRIEASDCCGMSATARGGTCKDGKGGDGGTLTIKMNEGSDPDGKKALKPGNILLSGLILFNGGNGATGGSGGLVNLQNIDTKPGQYTADYKIGFYDLVLKKRPKKYPKSLKDNYLD